MHLASPTSPTHVAVSSDIMKKVLQQPASAGRLGLLRLKTAFSGKIGKGYPSIIAFGPKMSSAARNLADFESVFRHGATHAQYWATGQLLYADKLDTDKARHTINDDE
jgi:hypothetical protein